LEFENRMELPENVLALLNRIIHIPMHQYARYFEKYRALAQLRPLTELLPEDTLAKYREEVERESGYIQVGGQVVKKSELETERELRRRIDELHTITFTETQTETTKRWTFESAIKRPYFHVTDLDEAEVSNWRKYLDFEESEGDIQRIKFLYERCLVTCAFHEEFWFRYARWISAQEGREEEARNIYQRGSMLFVPVSKPGFRLMWALFEETCDRSDLAILIHEGILATIPGDIETIRSLANTQRRHNGVPAAIEVFKAQIEAPETDQYVKAWCLQAWVDFLWKHQGSIEEAREIFQKYENWYLDSKDFWLSYLQFETEQLTDAAAQSERHKRVHDVHEAIWKTSQLSPLEKNQLTQIYLNFLLERGTSDAAKEYMTLDRKINGQV
jgi:pre-mRNA-processing factor 39